MSQKHAVMQSITDQFYRGRLPAAEHALRTALLALTKGKDPCVGLREAAEALRAAHWLPAMRLNDALLHAWSHGIAHITTAAPSLPQRTDSVAEPGADLQEESASPSASDALPSAVLDSSTSDSSIDADSLAPSAVEPAVEEHTALSSSTQDVSEQAQEASSHWPAEQAKAFHSALGSFLKAVQNAPLREFTWSSGLVELYEIVSTNQSKPIAVLMEECAGAGYIWPAVFFHTSYAGSQLMALLTELRMRYERALLILLNSTQDEGVSLEDAALEELDACLNALIELESATNPRAYDMGRLVGAWIHIRRQMVVLPASHPFSTILHMQIRRVYALMNPLWVMAALKASSSGENQEVNTPKQPAFQLPPACVQALVISLWGMLLAYCMEEENAKMLSEEYAVLLADYGIAVTITKQPHAKRSSPTQKALTLWKHAGLRQCQHLGALELSQDAYAYFQTQLQHIVTELESAMRDVHTKKQEPASALGVAQVADRLAGVAHTAGLGNMAFVAGNLALAWRRYAHQGFQLRSEELVQASYQTEYHHHAVEGLSPQSIADAHTALSEITQSCLEALKVLKESASLEDSDITRTLEALPTAWQGALATLIQGK